MSKITTERHYKITLKDGSTYYGRTTQPGDDRYNQHQGDVRRNKHPNKNIQESYNKYGYDDWVHEWLSTETGDKQHHDQIEYGYVQADPKALNINKGKWVICEDGGLEYNRVYQQQRRDKETPEQKEERRHEGREYQQQKRDNETPEEREERLRKQREYSQRKRDEKKRGGDNK